MNHLHAIVRVVLVSAAIAIAAGCIVCAAGCANDAARNASGQKLATTQEVIASKLDLWGEAALKEPGGASYEFFEKLLPPLRYVDADFRVYPILLSAPAAKVKGRILSDGST